MNTERRAEALLIGTVVVAVLAAFFAIGFGVARLTAPECPVCDVEQTEPLHAIFRNTDGNLVVQFREGESE